MAEMQTLKRFGYETLSANDGESAVRTARDCPELDLVLMDIDLGRGMDGTEAARLILEERTLPIVFLTSHSEREMVEKVRGITRYGYVIKNSGDFVLQSSIEMAFELFSAHEKMKAEENRLRTLVQTIPDLVWLKDIDGVYVRCNRQFERFFGAAEADIVGKTDYDFVDDALARFFRDRDRIAMEADEATVNYEWVTFAEDGKRVYLETIKTPLKDEWGKSVGILGVARDITEHKRVEDSLEESRKALAESERAVSDKLRAILEPEGDIGTLELADIIDTARLQRIMDDFNELTGMNIGIIDRRGRNLVSTGWQDICRKFHRADARSCLRCRESDEEFARNIEQGRFMEYRCKNGLWDVATPIRIAGAYLGNIKTGQFIYEHEEIDTEAFRRQAREFGYEETAYMDALGRVPRWSKARVEATMRFYTELALIIGNLSYSNIQLARTLSERERLLKAAKESERRFSVISNFTVDWESWFSPEGKYLWVNPGVESVTGYAAEEILAMPDFIETLIAPEDKDMVRELFATAGPDTRLSNLEIKFVRKDGEVRWLNVSSTAIVEADGTFIGFRVSGRDTTEKKRDEERLARSVTEKEILLRELKHRVKNSLAIVSSLLSLNKDRIADEQASRVFLEAIARVKSVSAIYDRLNSSEKLDRINIDAYIKDLVSLIAKTYTVDESRISFATDIESRAIELKAAVPIGLILNELVTNAIKYAYSDGDRGEVRISFSTRGEAAVLRVSDDGRGLPPGFDAERTDSLGIRISGMLAKQIGGTLRFVSEKGTTAELTFKA